MPEETNTFRDWRDAMQMSQSEISYEFVRYGRPLTAATISGWERGQVPDIDLVDAIAAVYKKTARQVLDVMHEMAQPRAEAKKLPAAAR